MVNLILLGFTITTTSLSFVATIYHGNYFASYHGKSVNVIETSVLNYANLCENVVDNHACIVNQFAI